MRDSKVGGPRPPPLLYPAKVGQKGRKEGRKKVGGEEEEEEEVDKVSKVGATIIRYMRGQK